MISGHKNTFLAAKRLLKPQVNGYTNYKVFIKKTYQVKNITNTFLNTFFFIEIISFSHSIGVV